MCQLIILIDGSALTSSEVGKGLCAHWLVLFSIYVTAQSFATTTHTRVPPTVTDGAVTLSVAALLVTGKTDKTDAPHHARRKLAGGAREVSTRLSVVK